MTLLIELEASFSERSVTLAGSGVTAYTVNAGVSLGATVASPLMSRTFDGSRALVTGAPVGAREQQIPLRVSGSTVADLQAALDAVWRVCEDITLQGGGVLRYRSASGSYVTRYRVVSAQLQVGELETYEAHVWQRVTLVLVVDPYGLPDAYGIVDSFNTDTLGSGGVYNLGGADWTRVVGSGSISVSGGAATTATTTGFTVYTHTGTPHTFGDVQVTAKVSLSTVALNKFPAVMLKYIDASNYLYARMLSNGAALGTLAVISVVAGVESTVSTVGITGVAVATSYWMRVRIEGNVVSVEWFTSEPTPLATPAFTDSDPLTTAQAALFGSAIRGRVGIGWNTQGSGTVSFDDFRVEPLTYRNVTFPTTLRLEGAWGGTTDALAGIYYTGSGGTAPTCMLYAWWPRTAAHNMVWNGGGEVVGNVAATAYGWGVQWLSGINSNAAVSVSRITSKARTGSACIQIVSHATNADSGGNFLIYRRGGFRKGVTYTAQCYATSTASTSTMRIGLGVTGNRALEIATALSASWVLHTVSWTPTADSDTAYFVASVQAGGQTFEIDDVQVYEGTTAPTSTLGGHGPGIIPAAAYNTAAASISGTAWTQTTDTDYLVGTGPQASGALTTLGNLEFPILPHLFTPDDYTTDEVDVAVFARVELASTQTSLAATLSIASERGTSYGARRYGSYRATGKTLTLPSSGTRFKPYYLGTITLKVDKTRPRREWLRLALTNSGAATGTVGIDYLIVVPVRSYCSTQPGSTDAITADFIASTAETTKAIGISTNGEITAHPGTAAIVEHTNSNSFTPDDGLLGEPLHIPPDGATLLVWPSDQVIDLADSSAHSMAETFAGTVTVAMQPRVHLLKQS